MDAPDRAVDELWRLTITAPARWGRDTDRQPLVRGTARAAGVLLVPVGFAVFVLALVLVLAPVAICYDAVVAVRALAVGEDGRSRRR